MISETKKVVEKKLARDVNMLIAAENIKQMFDELINAGFTEKQAIEYLSSLVAKTSMQMRMYRSLKRKT